MTLFICSSCSLEEAKSCQVLQRCTAMVHDHIQHWDNFLRTKGEEIIVFEVFELWENFLFFLRLPKKTNFETLPISPCNPVPSPLDLHCKSLASTLSHPPARAYFESSAEDPDQGGSTQWFTVSTLFTKNPKKDSVFSFLRGRCSLCILIYFSWLKPSPYL